MSSERYTLVDEVTNHPEPRRRRRDERRTTGQLHRVKVWNLSYVKYNNRIFNKKKIDPTFHHRL
jgi:hypothetical protein